MNLGKSTWHPGSYKIQRTRFANIAHTEDILPPDPAHAQ
jgi:hypothetical protein